MGTGMAIFLILVFVLCVLLLVPFRVKASFGDGAWAVTVYYAWFRVYHKESQPKEKPDTPQKPDPVADTPAPEPDASQGTAADADVSDVTAAEPQPHTPSEPEATAEPAESTPEAIPEQTAADVKPTQEQLEDEATDEAALCEAEAAPDDDAEAPKSKKQSPIKRFIERLKPHSISEAIAVGKDALAALSPALKFLTRHFHFRHVRLYLAVGTDDPARTATLYGKLCAGAYNLLAALQCWVDIETDEFRILADFYNESITLRAALELRVSPAALILTLLILGVKFLWRAVCRFRREDKEAKLIAEETKPAAA